VVTEFTTTGVLTLNRIDTTGAVTLQNDVGGGGPAVVSASIVIEKLA
jgi:uridine phosphorylase